MHHIIQKYEERLTPLIKRIEKLEQYHAIKGVEAITQHSAEEDDIIRQLHTLTELALQAGDVFYRKVGKRLQSLVMRLHFLPSVPRIEVVRLAQNILAQKPLVLMTDDNLNEKLDKPELTRIFLMDTTETPCFDYRFASSGHKSVRTLKLNTAGEKVDARVPLTTLETAWLEFQTAIHGRYVVAFDLPLVQLQLALTAQEYRFPVPMVVGHCLQDLLLQYAGLKEPIPYEINEDHPSWTNAELCDLLESDDIVSFYDASLAPADQRARHLFHALQSMADGTLSLQDVKEKPYIRHINFHDE